jgi:hypothetical protein
VYFLGSNDLSTVPQAAIKSEILNDLTFDNSDRKRARVPAFKKTIQAQ